MTGRRRRRPASPYRFFLVVAAVIGGVVVAGLRWLWAVPWPLAYLAGVNVSTFLLYGYDKAAARRARGRVPERVLLGLVLAGGSPAALLAGSFFRHKTVKASFLRQLFAIVAVQVVVIAGWAYWWYR